MQTTQSLADGNAIPLLGLGTWKAEKQQVGNAVRFALQHGYRHIDCASIYRNEKEVGGVFKQVIGSAIKREELFVTSKLWNTFHEKTDVEKACKQTLADLHLEYLDLYLIHWGIAFKRGKLWEAMMKNGDLVMQRTPLQETWEGMELLVKKGLVKSIGVANYTAPMLVDLLSYANIHPVVNQIEVHPYNVQTELVDYCKRKKIVVTAYSPLGRAGVGRGDKMGPKLLEDPIITKLAEKYHQTPAQIVLRWGLQRHTVVIPKSITQERILENSQIFDFTLNKSDMKDITACNKNYRFVNPIEWWNIPYFA